MRKYLDLLEEVADGSHRADRTGVGTRALFGRPLTFDLSEGFPAVTTKRLAFKAVVGELLWFLEGSCDERRLAEIMGTDETIWTANARADYWLPKARFPGDVGRTYGAQWRSWRGEDGEEIDQLARVIEQIKKDPFSRRHVVTAWNPAEVDETALPPCHMLYQFFAAEGKLSLCMYQRSCDMFLGLPFNIASYALLVHMVAQVIHHSPGTLTIMLGDAHIYDNHVEQVDEQLNRNPRPLPMLRMNPYPVSIDGFSMSDFELTGYTPHPSIRADMAV